MKKKKETGFTLVELLTVIVILAIITVIAVPTFGRVQKNIKEKQYRNKLELVKVAALKYADDTNYTAFYIDDLISNGYLDGDKMVKTDGRGKQVLLIDDRDNKTIMNCYVVIIKEENGVLSAEVDEQLDEDNKNFESEGCKVNLPNNSSEYFNVEIYEYLPGESNKTKLIYDKYNKWWTKNSVEFEISQKSSSYPIEKVEWLEGNNSVKTDTLIDESGTVLKTSSTYKVDEAYVASVLQQNYTARVTIKGKEYSVTMRAYIDKRKPNFYAGTADYESNEDTPWVKKMKYSIQAYDNESGLYSYFVEKSNSDTCNCPATKDDTKFKKAVKNQTIVESGKYCVCLVDNVGNINKTDKPMDFDKIDGAVMACNLNIEATKSTYKEWYIGESLTLRVKPITDGAYSVGASGVKLGVNTVNNTWPTNDPQFKEMDKDTYEANKNNDNAFAYLTLNANVNGDVYYGHIGNKAGEDKICRQKVYYEKSITSAEKTGSTPYYNNVTIAFKTGNAISGIKSAVCYRTVNGVEVSGSRVNATMLDPFNLTATCKISVPVTKENTTYNFNIVTTSNAGNTSTLSTTAANSGYCNSATWKYSEWSAPQNVCVKDSPQTRTASCTTDVSLSEITDKSCPTSHCGTVEKLSTPCTDCGERDDKTSCTWGSYGTCSNVCGGGSKSRTGTGCKSYSTHEGSKTVVCNNNKTLTDTADCGGMKKETEDTSGKKYIYLDVYNKTSSGYVSTEYRSVCTRYHRISSEDNTTECESRTTYCNNKGEHCYKSTDGTCKVETLRDQNGITGTSHMSNNGTFTDAKVLDGDTTVCVGCNHYYTYNVATNIPNSDRPKWISDTNYYIVKKDKNGNGGAVYEWEFGGKDCHAPGSNHPGC